MSSRDSAGGRAMDQVMRNSLYLVASTAITAALGFVFWIAAARLFTAAQVGAATSLINAMVVIAYLSLLGLNSTLVRFPAPPAERNRQITQSIMLVFGVACIIASAYLAGLPWYGQKLMFIRDDPVQALLLVLFCALSAVNLLTDWVFISARLSQYNTLIDGLIQGLTKLALPFALLGMGAFGIVTATGGGYAVAVLASLYFMRRRLGFRFSISARATRPREQWGFSAASYFASVLNLIPLLVVPLIVLQQLGAEATGYYFVAFQIANLANTAAFAVGEAMFAEISADEARFGAVLRRSAGLMAAALIPAASVLALGSGPLLRLFGGTYEAHAQALLVALALSTLTVAFNTWVSFAIKLARLMGPLIWSNVVFAVTVIGMAALWADHGLVWVGWAWCTGNLASGIVAAIALARVRHRFAARGLSRPTAPTAPTIVPAATSGFGPAREATLNGESLDEGHRSQRVCPRERR